MVDKIEILLGLLVNLMTYTYVTPNLARQILSAQKHYLNQFKVESYQRIILNTNRHVPKKIVINQNLSRK
jgi:hypothetical protein